MENSTNLQANTSGENSNSIDTLTIINCAILVLLIPIAIVGNTLVLAAIFRTPSLRSPSFVFICSLAISDLLVGVIIQPLYTVSLFVTLQFLKTIAETTAYATCGVSLGTMTVISVDRLLALRYHMRHPTLVTSSRAIYTTLVMLFIDSVVTAIYFCDRAAYRIIIVVYICICLFTSTVSYITIYQIVRRHKAQIHVQQLAVQSSNISNATGNNINIIQLKRSAINTFVFYIAMILCYFPVVISISIYSLSFEKWTKTWNFADTLAFMNSSINPFLFCWRLRDLRKAVLKIGRQVLCGTTHEN